MRILIFDTETTDLKGWIVEVAYLVVVPEGEKLRVVKGKASGINPLKPVSPYVRKRFFLDEEKLKECPVFSDFWRKAGEDFLRADLVVAHNVQFDLKVLERELVRIGKLKEAVALKRKRKFCTCRDLARLMRLSKWPKLEEALRMFGITERKVKGSFERIRERLNYNPAGIRTKEILFHNALFDVVALGHLVSKAWKLIRAEINSPPYQKLF